MDALMLSRWQFAIATIFHFLFVPLTLGLSVFIAILETRFVRTGDKEYRDLAKFWGKLFLINFAIGVVTGITLEFQFGTNWSRYSQYVGDIFGSLLAIEATVAFFLESTFVAAWFFSWNRVSAKTHAIFIWLVALASNMSAIWILIANSWMQKPVGYTLRNGRAELTDFWAVVLSPFAWMQILHVWGAAFIITGFFVMSISAYHLLRKSHISFFTKSFRLGLGIALVFSLFELVQGHLHGIELVKHQPVKMAAMEAHWETQTEAPVYAFALPDEENEKNRYQFLPIPGALSFMAHHSMDAQVKGLKDYPKEERPPVMLTFFAFRHMVILGIVLIGLTCLGWILRNKLSENRWYLKIMLFALPLPYIASELGWLVTEMGRQPWIVYHVMKTTDAVSPIGAGQVAVSLVAMTLLYTVLGAVAIYLMRSVARKGPVVAIETAQPATAKRRKR